MTLDEEGEKFNDEVFGEKMGDKEALVGQLIMHRKCTATPTSSIPGDNCLKLVQHTPAWALHAFLRFHGIRYVTSNSEFHYAFGKQ